MNVFRPTFILLAKDLRLEWRSKEVLSSTVFFAMIALTVIYFGFQPGRFQVANVGPGILWTAFLFSALLGMNRMFQAES